MEEWGKKKSKNEIIIQLKEAFFILLSLRSPLCCECVCTSSSSGACLFCRLGSRLIQLERCSPPFSFLFLSISTFNTPRTESGIKMERKEKRKSY